MAEKDFPNVYKVLDEYGEQVLTEMENILVKANKRATGNLISSLDYDVNEKDNGLFELIIEYAAYGKFIQDGRKPGSKLPPTTEIEKWLKTKGYKTIKGTTTNSAINISRSIAKKGIKGLDFNKPYTDLKNSSDFQNDIAEAYKKDIENQIKNSLK